MFHTVHIIFFKEKHCKSNKRLFLAFYHLTALLFTVLPKDSSVEYAAKMRNEIPSTFSLHTLIVLSHSKRINRRTAGGLICPQTSFIFLQGSLNPPLQDRQVVTQVFPSSWLRCSFPSSSAKEIHIVLRRQVCSLSLIRNHTIWANNHRTAPCRLGGHVLNCRLKTQSVSRAHTQDQCQFPSRLVPNCSPPWHSIKRCNLVSSSRHTLHLGVSVRLILRRSFVRMRSWITRNNIALMLS
jgi:hypothetical protein